MSTAENRAGVVARVAEIIAGYLEVDERIFSPGHNAREHAEYVNRVFGWRDDALGLTGERLTTVELARAFMVAERLAGK